MWLFVVYIHVLHVVNIGPIMQGSRVQIDLYPNISCSSPVQSGSIVEMHVPEHADH
jgi:hypothetical protein